MLAPPVSYADGMWTFDVNATGATEWAQQAHVDTAAGAIAQAQVDTNMVIGLS